MLFRSVPLAALSVLAAVPAIVYARSMLVEARGAGPSCFFGQCAHGDRFAEMAALAIAVMLLGLLAATRSAGWRITAWSVGAATVVVGSASLIWPDLSGSLGQVAGAVTVAWGILFVVVAEWTKRAGTSAGAFGRGPGR